MAMYTPVFWVDQDEKDLIVRVKALYARPSEVDVFFAETEFLFYCPPYFLRLFLPGKVVECEGECVHFNPENNVFTIRAPKMNVGEHFPDLDMLTRLLVPEGSPAVGTCNVKLPGETTKTELSYNRQSREVPLNQLYFEQKLPPGVAEAATECRYGFASSRDHVFLQFKEASDQLIDIDDPDCYTSTRRRQILYEKERDKFSEDAYLWDGFLKWETPLLSADLHNEEVDHLLALESPWKRRICSDNFLQAPYSIDEIERLKNLPKKNVTVIPELERAALFSLVDILFGFAYDCRINDGDDCNLLVDEIRRTFSGRIRLEHKEVKFHIIRPCYVERYPLSHTRLRKKIIVLSTDSKFQIFHANRPRFVGYTFSRSATSVTPFFSLIPAEYGFVGKVQLIKCLLSIHQIFANTGDFVYLFNDLYITDYCVWVQALR
ncbi:protein SHQ1 [Trichuris trichiura]|uniref:Protein SHQ1 homolog n=1 Tax=Trichuris trichiura TaxID=36087 RepID=A0A077Z8K2_TRITR|nr:protein SHQ1 [Trichuris trichiura]